jgi:hypothetical protein
MQRSRICFFLLSAIALTVCIPLSAATVIQMNLAEMVGRAGLIFRGTVLDAREGTVQVGGGTLPVVTYRVRVDDELKGTFDEVKGVPVAEIKMLGKLKPATSGSLRSLGPVADLPRLEVGQEYLLLTTPRSAVGLSTIVGLGQGRFVLQGKRGQEVALNDNHNRGLFRGMDTGPSGVGSTPEGAVPYAVLADLIRDIVGE